ncbi:hypothetical protein PENSUB_3682 [Penicillium subrubescens]|uniref:Uncharacterized protein n=1 Tax=Penicillium subrubescens TaxID=1316194 RepID=A0A1Q5UEG3_9EURO|nr:hypothetical protein PENSUB_3682 [Penicillium subrubescens]
MTKRAGELNSRNTRWNVGDKIEVYTESMRLVLGIVASVRSIASGEGVRTKTSINHNLFPLTAGTSMI